MRGASARDDQFPPAIFNSVPYQWMTFENHHGFPETLNGDQCSVGVSCCDEFEYCLR